jgi:hypothetical protein
MPTIGDKIHNKRNIPLFVLIAIPKNINAARANINAIIGKRFSI